MSEQRFCVVIPVYNHHHALAQTVAKLSPFELPAILVDDGSNDACKAELARVAQLYNLELVTLATNTGKGGAVKAGINRAQELGYSHALQIDADGQHDTRALPTFLNLAKQTPQALICGVPEYDASVPKARFYLRYLTHVWVWINTLSLSIIDSMCGFRVYPLAASCHLIDTAAPGDRMEFDTEFIVNWYWAGLPLVQLQTKVIYPAHNTSRFRPFQDNVRISWMHARLFFRMLPRAPSLLVRKQDSR